MVKWEGAISVSLWHYEIVQSQYYNDDNVMPASMWWIPLMSKPMIYGREMWQQWGYLN